MSNPKQQREFHIWATETQIQSFKFSILAKSEQEAIKKLRDQLNGHYLYGDDAIESNVATWVWTVLPTATEISTL